jgi:hypothetical protein
MECDPCVQTTTAFLEGQFVKQMTHVTSADGKSMIPGCHTRAGVLAGTGKMEG